MNDDNITIDARKRKRVNASTKFKVGTRVQFASLNSEEDFAFDTINETVYGVVLDVEDNVIKKAIIFRSKDINGEELTSGKESDVAGYEEDLEYLGTRVIFTALHAYNSQVYKCEGSVTRNQLCLLWAWEQK